MALHTLHHAESDHERGLTGPTLWLDDESWHGERPWPAFDVPAKYFRHEKTTFSWALLRREGLLIAAGVMAVVVLAGIVAFFVAGKFGAGVALVTMFFLTAYIVLLTTPVWLAAILDDVEDHADELKERPGVATED